MFRLDFTIFILVLTLLLYILKYFNILLLYISCNILVVKRIWKLNCWICAREINVIIIIIIINIIIIVAWQGKSRTHDLRNAARIRQPTSDENS